MSSLFGKKVPVRDQLRQHKRNIDRAVRDIERERIKFKNQETQIMNEIKQLAKKNQMASCKIMAKDLVRTRAFAERMLKMKASLQTIGLRLQTLKSSEQLTATMAGVGKAMSQMNAHMNVPGLQAVMRDFEKQNVMMDSKQEMIGDTLDDMFEAEDEEENAGEVVESVLAELGISATDGYAAAPTNTMQTAVTGDQLAARFDDLDKQFK